jgi:hypothetical protein
MIISIRKVLLVILLLALLFAGFFLWKNRSEFFRGGEAEAEEVMKEKAKVIAKAVLDASLFMNPDAYKEHIAPSYLEQLKTSPVYSRLAEAPLDKKITGEPRVEGCDMEEEPPRCTVTIPITAKHRGTGEEIEVSLHVLFFQVDGEWLVARVWGRRVER